MHVATAVTNSPDQDASLEQMRRGMQRNRIGTIAFDICKRRTSSGNATRPRNSIERTTSDSI